VPLGVDCFQLNVDLPRNLEGTVGILSVEAQLVPAAADAGAGNEMRKREGGVAQEGLAVRPLWWSWSPWRKTNEKRQCGLAVLATELVANVLLPSSASVRCTWAMGLGALPLVTPRPKALTNVTRDTSPAALQEVLQLACEVRP
jgi:hypothetical protein